MATKPAELLLKGATDGEFTDVLPVDLDPDSEGSWDEWIESLKGSEHPGVVRAYKIPTDAEGNPITSKGAKQIHLGAWAHQQYDYDGLIAKIKGEYMRPGETAVIRITGTRPGRRGVIFNQILTLQRSAESVATNTTQSGGVNFLEVVRTMQDATRQQTELMERLLAPKDVPQGKPMMDSVKEWTAVLGPILSPIILAMLARPKPQSDIGELIGALVKLNGMVGKGGGGSGGDDDDSVLGIIKTIGPGAMNFLTEMAKRNPAPPLAPPRRRQLAAPTPTPTPIAPKPVPELTAEEAAMLAQLKPQLDQLATMAEQKADPKEVAKLVLDMLPDNEEVDDQIYNLISNEASFRRLLLLSPELTKHAAWFETLRVALLAEYTEPDQPAAQPVATG